MKLQPSWMGEGGMPSNRGWGPDLTACLVGLGSHSRLHWGCCSTRTGPKYVGSLVCTESLHMYVRYTNSFSIQFLAIPRILYIWYLLKYISYLQQLTIRIELAEDFFFLEIRSPQMAHYTLFLGKMPPFPPPKNLPQQCVGRRGTNQLRLLERYLDVLVKHTTESPPSTALVEVRP